MSPGTVAQLAISVFDEITKDYHFGEISYFLPLLTDPNAVVISTTDTVSQTILDIVMPAGRLSGTMDAIYVQGHADNVLGLYLRMEARGPILPNLVNGIIPFGGG